MTERVIPLIHNTINMVLFERNSWLWMSFFAVLCLACSKSIDGPDEDKDDPKLPSVTEVTVTSFKSSSRNDREMIQKAVDYASSTRINKVRIPAGGGSGVNGRYMVDLEGSFLLGGVQLRDHTHLILDEGAVIKATPSTKDYYNILGVNNVCNVTIEGGTIIGERYEHIGTTGEGGHAIILVNSCNVTVKNITLRDCWGDGMVIRNDAKNSILDNVICDNNRRQGVSVSSCDGLQVLNSVFKNTNGKNPRSGIDLEPDYAHNVIRNVRIINSQFLDNEALGLHIWGKYGEVRDVYVKGCVMSGSPVGFSMRHEFTSNITVEDVVISGSTDKGVMIGDKAKQINIDGLKVTTADGIGIRVENAREVEMRNLDVRAHTSVISLNRDTLITIEKAKLKSIVNHAGNGLYTANCGNLLIDKVEVEGCNYGFNITSNTNITVSNSTVVGNKEFGMWFTNTQRSTFTNNIIRNTSQVGLKFGGSDNTISNNEFVDNGFLANSTYAQALFEGTTQRNTVSGNIFKTSTKANKPRYAIHLSSSGTVNNNTGTGNVYEANSWITATVKNDGGTGNNINP